MDNSLTVVLKKDLEILNSILEQVQSKNLDKVNSWLFPTKDHCYVDEILLGKDLSTLSYSRFLELIVDRLYCIISSLTSYIESNFIINDSRLILRPKQLTLGFSVNLLWNMLQNIVELNNLAENQCISDSPDFQHKECQTDVISINKCDSCLSAISCMKNLMDCLRDYQEETEDREKIRCKVYDITQFGMMMKTTTSIEKCLTSVFDKLYSEKRKNESLEEDIRRLNLELNNKLDTITLLEKEITILKEKTDKESYRLMRLLQENRGLMEINNKSHLKLNTYEEIVFNLNQVIKTYQLKIDGFVREKNNQQENLLKVVERQKRFSRKFRGFLQHLQTNQHDGLQNFLEKNQNIVDVIDNSVSNCKKDCSVLTVKLQEISKNNEQDCSEVLNRFRAVQERMVEFVLKIKSTPTSQPQENPKTKLKGNPIEDMTNQIQTNNNTIAQLQEENSRLEKILQKFQKIKIV